MKTEMLRSDHPAAIEHAVDIIRNGGLVAFPTDTIYGMAAQLTSPRSIESLYSARGPGSERSVGILFADPADLPRIVRQVTPAVQRVIDHFWPGQLTLVLPGHPRLPLNLLHTNSAVPARSPGITPIAIRIPDHPFALNLLRSSGPLAVSAASRVGGPHPKMAQDVLSQMNGRIHLLLDGGPVPVGTPSLVVDCMGKDPVELRPGSLQFQEVLEIYRNF